MSFGYSITITFVMWILGIVLIIALFMPDIKANINAVNKINQDYNLSSDISDSASDMDTSNLIEYTPLAILNGLK